MGKFELDSESTPSTSGSVNQRHSKEGSPLSVERDLDIRLLEIL